MSNYVKQSFKVGEILKAAKLNAMDEQIAALSENPGGVTKEEMEAAIEEAIEEAILNTMNTPV